LYPAPSPAHLHPPPSFALQVYPLVFACGSAIVGSIWFVGRQLMTSPGFRCADPHPIYRTLGRLDKPPLARERCRGLDVIRAPCSTRDSSPLNKALNPSLSSLHSPYPLASRHSHVPHTRTLPPSRRSTPPCLPPILTSLVAALNPPHLLPTPTPLIEALINPALSPLARRSPSSPPPF